MSAATISDQNSPSHNLHLQGNTSFNAGDNTSSAKCTDKVRGENSTETEYAAPDCAHTTAAHAAGSTAQLEESGGKSRRNHCAADYSEPTASPNEAAALPHETCTAECGRCVSSQPHACDDEDEHSIPAVNLYTEEKSGHHPSDEKPMIRYACRSPKAGQSPLPQIRQGNDPRNAAQDHSAFTAIGAGANIEETAAIAQIKKSPSAGEMVVTKTEVPVILCMPSGSGKGLSRIASSEEENATAPDQEPQRLSDQVLRSHETNSTVSIKVSIP